MDSKPAMRRAVKDCADRGLYEASKWVAEFLLVYPTDPQEQRQSSGSISAIDSTLSSSALNVPGPSPSNSCPPKELALFEDEPMDEETADLFMIARAHYDSKEHERVAFLLRYVTHPKARFLGLYSRYLSSEKKAHDVWMSRKEIKPDPRKNDQKPPAPINEELSSILHELPSNIKDPFLLFLRAIILRNLLRKAEALESAIRSLQVYPWNWSCWKLLWDVVDDHDVIDRMRPLLPHLPQDLSSPQEHPPIPHPLTRIFIIGVMIESHAMTPELERDLDDLVAVFPHSLHLRTLQAHYAYSVRDYDHSLELFASMLSTDPYRTDEVDTYSNILYTMKKQAEISQLAQHFMVVNRDRPEVSLVIGNYFSLRNEHQTAVRYYQRAVQLYPAYGAAWILMGHEFLEMKNSHAAIEAYRRGLDINKKDYRAWHGLGQAYELLDMPQYALHYFQRSTALRPYDIRMWRALSKTYQILKQYREAIECQQRALIGESKTDTHGHAVLAELHELSEAPDEAASYHRRVVEICLGVDNAGLSGASITLRDSSAPVEVWAKSAIAFADWVIELRQADENSYVSSVTDAIPTDDAPAQSRRREDTLGLEDFKERVSALEAAMVFMSVLKSSNAAESNKAEGTLKRLQDKQMRLKNYLSQRFPGDKTVA